jgi:magnesium transporter
MISVDVCRGKQVTRGVPPQRISELIASGKQTVWVDVEAPGEDDWRVLSEEFRFHPLAMEDARKQNQRAKVDPYDGYLFLTARFWTGVKGVTDDLNDVTDEIDIFLGASYLVTVHNRDCPLVQEVRTRWERHPEQMPDQPAFLLYVLLDTIVDSYFPAVDAIDEDTDTLETAIYTPGATIDIAPALVLKKRLLLLRQTISPMRDVLNQILRADQPLIPPPTRVYYQDVYDHTLRLVEQVDLHRDILAGALDAIVAQTNNRLNQVMKTLTGISTILMSAALIAGIYGMNFKNMPELNTRYGYHVALLSMALIAGALALYFRRIKWF